MTDQTDFHITYQKIIGISWVIIAIVSILLLIIGLLVHNNGIWYEFALSYLLGAMTNLFVFNLLKNSVANLTSDIKSAISGSFSNYVIRFLAYAFILYISFTTSKLNPYCVLIGFFTIRIAIYIFTWRERRENLDRTHTTDKEE